MAAFRFTFIFAVLVFAPSAARAQDSTAVPKESDYYRIESIPIPEGLVFEVGGLALLPTGDVGVATRRGDVWIVENPYMTGGTLPFFRRFARGLHEPLGLAYRDGDLYAAQRGELTRLRDTNGDWIADRYEAVAVWPLEGNYHEYSYGPVILPNGNMVVTLNLAWVGSGASLSKWRGWALEISPSGKIEPMAVGMRSPAGIGLNAEGDLFFGENQGDWIGSGYITHIERGDFVGHPAGLRWASLDDSPLRLKPEDVPDTGNPLFEVAQDIPGFKPPSVWLPHIKMGISTSGILADTTAGRFGPFEGQLFVGDQGFSRINRVYLEKVGGEYQGAAFPFLEGFASGILRMIWGRDESMIVGMTSRGWDAIGKVPYALQRVVWTGEIPFEVKRMGAMTDGFELVFTEPVDESAGDVNAYQLSSFTYKYHHHYGSPEINQSEHRISRADVSKDGLRVRLVVDGLREGYIHELRMPGVRSRDGMPLLHDTAFYTLNKIPQREKSK